MSEAGIESPGTIKRPGIISWGMLQGQTGAIDSLKEHLLLYDEIWVPWLNSSYPTDDEIKEWDLDEEYLASISWLMSQGVIVEPPIDLDTADKDDVVRGLLDIYNEASRVSEKVFRTSEQAARSGAAASFNIDIALSRLTTYLLWRDRQEIAYPIAFPFKDFAKVPGDFKRMHDVLSVVIKRFPAPSSDVPLEDIVAFKRDPETKYKFAKFWQWVRKTAEGKGDMVQVNEELDSLMNEYTHHLHQLSKETRDQHLEIVLTSPADVIEDLIKLRLGNLARRFLKFRSIKIAAHGAEMKLPGNEIAYITEASKALAPRRSRAA